MISARFKPGDIEATKYRLGSVADKVSSKIGSALEREAINLVSYIKTELSDSVLHVRTGRLRRSITYNLKQDGIDSFHVTVGTNVKYARVHEYGFKGTVNIPTHNVKASSRMQTMAFGKVMKNPRVVDVKAHVVKAHTVEMNMPKRPFMRPALDANTGRIIKNLKKAIFSSRL